MILVINISKEELEELYWGEEGTELGAPTIAKMLGCCKRTVYQYMEKYNIATRLPAREGYGECFTKDSRRQQSENMIENIKKGIIPTGHIPDNKMKQHLSEQKKGEKNPASKLKKKEGIAIYNSFKDGEKSAKDLMKEYDVSSAVVYRIIEGKHWTTKDLDKIETTDRKLTKKQGLEIYNKYQNGKITESELAKEYNVSRALIHFIQSCNHWTTEHLKET